MISKDVSTAFLKFLVWLDLRLNPDTPGHCHSLPIRSMGWDIYIYVIFGQVKTEFGVIPPGQENHSRAEHLNFPGRELNVIYYRAIFL